MENSVHLFRSILLDPAVCIRKETKVFKALLIPLQKVMDLKDELSTEHQRHIDDISTRTSHDTETQLAQMRIKYEDEIEQLKKLHGKELDQKLREQLNTLERKHKSEINKLVLRSQEQIELLKMRAGPDIGK